MMQDTDRRRPTILIADDSPVDLDLMVGYLSARQMHIAAAVDGDQALRMAQELKPDIILLDVLMPKLTGFEVCQRLKQLPSLADTPVIFVTDLAAPEDRVRGFEVGGIDFVSKPIEMNELCARVETQQHLHAMRSALVERNAELQTAITQLERYREGLEKLVVARTAELRDRNSELNNEVGERRRLQSALLEATDTERRRLAQEIHDGLGQDLVGIALLVDGAKAELKAGRAGFDAHLRRIGSATRNALKTTRDIARGLSPLSSTSGGLLEALNALRERVSGPPGPIVIIDVDPLSVADLPRDACNHLYRIAQEATSNAIKHATSRRIVIRLHGKGPLVRLEIVDDGCGFEDVDPTRRGLGLHTMRDRASCIGAALQVRANSSGGTAVICELGPSLARTAPDRA